MGDKIEKWCAHPAAFWFFTVAFIVGVRINVDISNIAISYFTAALLLLTLGGQRRSNKAMHVKLDDLEVAVDAANNENARLEELAEHEIEAKRNAIVG
jgi:low affinity Fe/Cu permease